MTVTLRDSIAPHLEIACCEPLDDHEPTELKAIELGDSILALRYSRPTELSRDRHTFVRRVVDQLQHRTSTAAYD